MLNHPFRHRFAYTSLMLLAVLTVPACGMLDQQTATMESSTAATATVDIPAFQTAVAAHAPDVRSHDQLVWLLTGTTTPTPKQRADYAYLEKINDDLVRVIIAAKTGQDVAAAAERNRVGLRDDGRVLIEVVIIADVDGTVEQLEALGMEVSRSITTPDSNTHAGRASGFVSPDVALQVAALRTIRSVMGFPLQPLRN